MPACPDDLPSAVLEWAGAHLAEDITVDTLARRFTATTGTTPHAWLLVGSGTAAGLREQFVLRRGVSPRAYRQTFRAGAGSVRATAVQLDGHRAGRVGSDHALVEAEFGQPA